MAEPEQLSIILTAPLVSQIAASVPSFLGLLEKSDISTPPRRFPDGSVELSLAGFQSLWPAIKQASDEGIDARNSLPLRSLAGWPLRHYRLMLDGATADEIGEARLLVQPSSNDPEGPAERRRDRLPVFCNFRRRVNRNAMISFAAAILRWAEMTGEFGIFGEGPARLAATEVLFEGSRAWFAVDVSRTGQATVNWLTLSLLEFGRDVIPITEITYGGRTEDLTPMARVPLPKARSDREELIPATDPGWTSSYSPTGTRPHESFRSSRFAILAIPTPDPDEVVMTIYFATTLSDYDRDAMARILDSWITLCQYGGFGQPGIAKGRFELDATTESARIFADFVGAELDRASAVLISALEGFSTGHAAIESIVFARS